MALISAAISFVALRLCSASFRTSSATTANPRPASPARAASMAAFNASHQNVVGARGHFHGRFANALENLGEIIEHVVDRISDVSKRVVGHLAALRQIASGDLVDDT